MTLRTIGTGAARWPTTVRTEPLAPRPEPVALLTDIYAAPGGGTIYAWRRDDVSLHPLPDLQRFYPSDPRDVLAPGGHTMLFKHQEGLRDESRGYDERGAILGIFSMSLTSGEIRRANIEPTVAPHHHLDIGCAPDGQDIVVAKTWQVPPSGKTPTYLDTHPTYVDTRVTLSLAGFDQRPPREVLTLTGSASGVTPLHWSPDGAWIAFAATMFEEKAVYSSLFVLDARTGDVHSRVDEVAPHGSAPWSPDSTNLLVSDDFSNLYLYDVRADSKTGVPFLDGPAPDGGSPNHPRFLGFADNRRLLVARQRGLTMTISAIDITTGEHQTLIKWTGTLDMYPVAATMPEGYWA